MIRTRLLAAEAAAIALTAVLAGPALAAERLVDAPDKTQPVYREWNTPKPAECPFGDSDVIRGLGFTGCAKIIGDDPLSLKIEEPSTFVSSSLPYGGRYPCGSLVYNGIWYYGTYCLDNEKEPGYNWGVMGPFVGFRYSKDFGKTWTQTPHTPDKPLFGEPKQQDGKVKFGSPHFVDFGKNMQYSPDGKAYLVGHGAVDSDPKPRPANLSWISGDQIYMARVTPTIENINDASKYEFFAGNDSKGRATWTKSLDQAKPILDWNNHCGCVTMTYNAPLKRYIMCVTDGWPTVKTMDTYIYESTSITGPWKLVDCLARFGTQAYFVNFPSKFISADGRTAWLCYSANFTWTTPSDPPGSRYGMCLQEVKLLEPSAPKVNNPLASGENIAPAARVRASSCAPGYTESAVVDMIVDGYPDAPNREWASKSERTTAMLRLDWNSEQTVDRVWLFDRPNTKTDQITSGMLIFSDGTVEKSTALPDDAKQGLEISFEPKKIRWMICTITGTKRGTENIGLSEIAVFKAK